MTRGLLTDFENAVGTLVAPLVAATRPADFVGQAASVVQIRVFSRVLADVPLPLIEETVAKLLRASTVWMPKPGELKAECAKVLEVKRKAVIEQHLEDCEHGSAHLVENDHGRMEKCPCWRRAVEAANRIGRSLELPPAQPVLNEEAW